MSNNQKKTWRFWHTHLGGIRREEWRVLTRENRIDLAFRHRAAYLSLFTFQNSVMARREERLCGDAIASTPLNYAPLFVLGHWRSGTTHLHNLLALDTEQFAWPTGFQVVFPWGFLTGEELRARLRRFPGMAPPATRPMDDVHITPDTPQEDEFALNNASLISPYLGAFSFPRRRDHYDRFLTLDDARPDELEKWKQTFHWYARKLTLHSPRPLLLKSPTHTARIGLLLELFPDARFVHIHRNPYEVFSSMRHMLTVLPTKDYLQQPDRGPDEWIFRSHVRMYDAFYRDRPLIPDGHFHEIRYADLVRDPVGQVADTYAALGLDGYSQLEPKLRGYVESLAGYRRNRFPDIAPEIRARVAREWGRSFERWGYAS